MTDEGKQLILFSHLDRSIRPGQPLGQSIVILLEPVGHRAVAQALQPQWPVAAELLWSAAEDVLAFMAFPESHWRRIYSTNVLERLNKEVKRRNRVVEIFRNSDAVIRLVGALLVEVDEEWQVQRRYFSQESMRMLYEPDLAQLGKPTPLTLAPVR